MFLELTLTSVKISLMSLNDDKIRLSSLIHLRGTIQVFSEIESSQGS